MLTITADGYGKRSSSYEYRQTGRGGQGIVAIDISRRETEVVGAFPVRDGDEIMLVTNGGKLIRMGVGDVRIAGRNTQGVILFRTDKGERVVSAEHLDDQGEGEGDDGADGAEGGDGAGDGTGA